MSADWTSPDELFEETDEARERRYEAERERRRKLAAQAGLKERQARVRKVMEEVADNYRLTAAERRAYLSGDWFDSEFAAYEDVRTLQHHVRQIIEELRSESA